MPQKKSKVIITPTLVVSDIEIYLDGQIGEASEYIDEFQAMRDASDKDQVHIYINNCGGLVGTGVQWLTVMSKCKAKITCHLEGECHSAATYVFLGGDEWTISPLSSMLVHNYSGGAAGKGVDITKSADATKAWVYAIMDQVYQGFLTEEELSKVKDYNVDYYFNGAEISERLSGVVSLREAMTAEAEAAKAAELEEQIELYKSEKTSLQDEKTSV